MKTVLITILVLSIVDGYAQSVSINNDGSTAHASAMLDVKSTTKGFLPPRMTQAQREAIVSPAPGLIIYQTDGTAGFYFHNGSTWVAQAGGGSSKWNLNGSHIYNSNAGFVGIGTSTPNSGLELRGIGSMTQMRITDQTSGNSLVLQGGEAGNLKVSGYHYGTGTARPLYLSVDGANTFLNPNGGLVGIGITSPTHALDVNGFFRASHVAGGNVVSETTGGVNSWAKLWMRTPVQQWSIGSSHNFNGNQLYFSNESAGGGIRMAIMPNGNLTQNASGHGLPKAMVSVGHDGTLLGCYNGVTGNSTGNCDGITSTREGTGYYVIILPFNLSSPNFVVATAQFTSYPIGTPEPFPVIKTSSFGNGFTVYIGQANQVINSNFTAIVY